MSDNKYIKKLSIIIPIFLLLFCNREKASLGEITTPSGLSYTVDISTTGDGKVHFSVEAEGAIYYHFFFNTRRNDNAFVSQDGTASYIYQTSCTGTQSYPVRVVAYGKGGVYTDTSFNVDVYYKSDIPPFIFSYLTGDGTKYWKWKKSEAGHIGLGEQFTGNTADSVKNYEANWYQAGPNEKANDGCLYEDFLIFSQKEGCNYTYELNSPSGRTFFRQEEVAAAIDGQVNPNSDRCYEYDARGEKVVSFKKISESNEKTTGIVMNFSQKGFMSFYLGADRDYEILSLTEKEMRIRVVQDFKTAESNGNFTWYHIFEATDEKPPVTDTTTPDNNDTMDQSTACKKGYTDSTTSGNYDVLYWSDEFDKDGKPCDSNWTYDIGAGGWGNGEKQYYTKRPDNVIVSDGTLKIIAKKEDYVGQEYTSTRLKSKRLFEFTYGRVVVRAKLPAGGGTWPAIWMLGANFGTNANNNEVPWPNCGEIDIMEHVGNEPDKVSTTIHYSKQFAGSGPTSSVTVDNATTEFHNYEMRWSSSSIDFYIDDQQVFTVDISNIPEFKKDFFLLLNIAMGGTLGGAIDPNFTSATMEIDYVRVYK